MEHTLLNSSWAQPGVLPAAQLSFQTHHANPFAPPNLPLPPVSPYLEWQTFEAIIVACQNSALVPTDSFVQGTEHIAIHVVSHGWDQVEGAFQLDEQWFWIKKLDTGLLGHLPKASRLAVLVLLRIMLSVCRLDGSSKEGYADTSVVLSYHDLRVPRMQGKRSCHYVSKVR